MTNIKRNFISYIGALLFICIIFILTSLTVQSQVKYRTFNQIDLSQKKAKPGKVLGSDVCFVFYNQYAETVNGLTARFNSAIASIRDSGGFPTIVISGKGKIITTSGRNIPPDDSVKICAMFTKKAPGTKVNFWWWMKDGVQFGSRNDSLLPSTDLQITTQPNGGNVREYLYKKIITRPTGLVFGIKSDSPGVGWIRYMTADRKFFPHKDSARCLDYIATGSGGQRPLIGELKNPHVKKHNNHLLGELHSLKLAIVANDSGVTEPWDPLTTPFGDLIYNDTENLSDPFNGLTIRQITSLADSALTYCSHFTSAFYTDLDVVISRINSAFDGAYFADSITPLRIRGTRGLEEVYFLQPNPGAASSKLRQSWNEGRIYPELNELYQNYPNPFNPTTTIEFNLVEHSIVTIKIYNVLGQEVLTLLQDAEVEEGNQTVEFIADNLPSGVYFYKITARGLGDSKNEFQAIKRMVMLK